MNGSTFVFLLLCSVVAAADAPGLTAAQAAKIFDQPGVEKDGPEWVPGYELARNLGIPTSQKDPYQVHYFSRHFADEDGTDHALARSKELGDYLIVVTSKTSISYLHADKDFGLVATNFFRRGDSESHPIAPEEKAAALFKAELALWAVRADKVK